MKTRVLGPNLTVSAIGLGCMGMSHAYGAYDKADAITALHRALDLGVTFFDTAEAYGPFANESLLGEALAPVRGRVTLATKFGFTFAPGKRDAEAISGMDGRPEHAREVAEASLKRLKTDVIDLYYLHRLDPSVPVEETVGAMADLVTEGKVRALGLSEVSPETLRRAQAVHPITALQSEYSLWTRDVETNGVLATCRELGIGFVPFSPLGRGFLTGGLTSLENLDQSDFRRALPRFQEENIDANRALVRVVEDIAREKGVTTAQVALAWVLARGEDIVPIPGARRLPHLEQNAGAVDVVLSQADLDRLDSTFTPEHVQGSRYPRALESMTDH